MPLVKKEEKTGKAQPGEGLGYIYVEQDLNRAVYMGDWKLVRTSIDPSAWARDELFNVATGGDVRAEAEFGFSVQQSMFELLQRTMDCYVRVTIIGSALSSNICNAV